MTHLQPCCIQLSQATKDQLMLLAPLWSLLPDHILRIEWTCMVTGLLPRRFDNGVTLSTSYRYTVSLEAIRQVIHDAWLHKGVVAIIADGLLLAVVAPAFDCSIITNHKAVRFADGCLSDNISHNFQARGAHHVHDSRFCLGTTANWRAEFWSCSF